MPGIFDAKTGFEESGAGGPAVTHEAANDQVNCVAVVEDHVQDVSAKFADSDIASHYPTGW